MPSARRGRRSGGVLTEAAPCLCRDRLNSNEVEKRDNISVPLAKIAAAGVALALCPGGSLAAACADAVVMAAKDRKVTENEATGVLAVMNVGMGVFASLTGLISCGVLTAAIAGIAVAMVVGSAKRKEKESPVKTGGPLRESEGEVIDAEFVDSTDDDTFAETRSGAICRLDPATIRGIVEKAHRRQL